MSTEGGRIEHEGVDAIVVGAGLAGLYAIHRLREIGLTVRGIEAADEVGGTWHWNRYPGCRCDVPSVEYSYSFDPELEQEWTFTENMSTQDEIKRYVCHVADRHGLREHIVFGTRVVGARFDDGDGTWIVDTDGGTVYEARWLILATGALSVPNVPDIAGLDSFAGTVLHTARWPRDGVELAGRRVGVIGTGSSGVQILPRAAEVAARVYVFQRTPTFAFARPLGPTDTEFDAYLKSRYRELRELQRRSVVGIANLEMPSPDGVAPGKSLGFGALPSPRDWADPELRRSATEAFEQMVRSVVRDPRTAEALIPTEYPLGCKRLVVEVGYFEAFNRDNVMLVDLREGAVTEVWPSGIRTEQGDFELDVLVLATGFDAISGSFARAGLVGRGGTTLTQKWAAGPVTYLGIMSAGFPNAFMITGPGSPSVISNMVVSIEQHVDFVAELIQYVRELGLSRVEPTAAAEADWVEEVNAAAAGTPFTDTACRSWYLGANVEGKPRVFMPYVGGVGTYRAICDDVARDAYRGFVLE